ncbi:MAG: PKD domain-containing protein [Bacteroidota bacterium]
MRNIIFYSILIVLASCQPKEEPGDIVSNTGPVFYAKGLANGTMFDLQAGTGNYYMEASAQTDTGGLLVFSGNLKNKDCSTCGPSLKFTVRNYTANASYSIDSALKPQRYDYYDRTVLYKTFYDAVFISQSVGSGTNTSVWDLGNGETFSGNELRKRFKEPAVYDVTHSNSFSAGCNSSITQQVHIPSANNGYFIDFNINYVDDTTVLFNTLPVDETAGVSWDFGDGHTGVGTISKHSYDTPGTYRVCMLIDKDSGDIRHCKNVNTRTFTACLSNFSYQVTTVNDYLQFSNVGVEWRDESGKLYTSAQAKQTASSVFNIIEKSGYEINQKGERTVKVKVKFTCQVSDGTSTIELRDIEAVIALAYQ